MERQKIVASQVQESSWNRYNMPFENFKSTHNLVFPEMTENILKILYIDSYHLYQTVSYYLAEMMD